MEGSGSMLHETPFGNDNTPTRVLMEDVGTDLLGAGDHIPTHAQTSAKEVERAIVIMKLQKLGKTLLHKLFGVPGVEFPGILEHQPHFQSWLESLSEQDQRIFTFTDQSIGSLTDPLEPPFTPTQLYAWETRITIGQLARVFKSLSCQTNADKVLLDSAGLRVPTLTVEDVLNLLSRPDMETTLGKEPCANIKALVVAILRKQLLPPNHPQLYRDFKELVTEFRRQVETSIFIVWMKREWRRAYDAALMTAVREWTHAELRTAGMEFPRKIVSMPEVSSSIFIFNAPRAVLYAVHRLRCCEW